MRRCPKCGREFASNERVCPDDGSLLDDTVREEDRVTGKTLDAKYRIEGFLKRGGMGAVYRGTHLMLGKPVAIKLIKPELVSSKEVVERFLREARAAAQLAHPNIVTVHDLGQTTDGTLYIAMELVDGRSLKEIIQKEGPWEPARAVRLGKAIARALALAHRKGVVHRDLKPQNIMVSRDADGEEIPKLLDFGIARTLEPDTPALTSTGVVLGTPHYMSSEQAKGLPADARSDLYALGIILYEMLAGRVPFDDTSIPSLLVKHMSEPPAPPTSVRPSIPRGLEAVVLRCLEKEPDARYQTAEALIEALDAPATAGAVAPGAHLSETLGETEVAPAPQHTGAGQALTAVPPPPPLPLTAPSSTTAAGDTASPATVRGRDLRAAEAPRRSGRVPVAVWLGSLAVVLLALVAGFALLRAGRPSGAPAPTRASAADVPVTAAATASTGEETAEASDAAPTAPDPTPSPSDVGGPAGTGVEGGGGSTTREAGAPGPAASEPEPESASEPTTSARTPRRVAAPGAVSSMPDRPPVNVRCEGVRDGCAALRFTLQETFERNDLPLVPARRAEILVAIEVEEVESRVEEQFGSTFVIRTYSVSAAGEVPRFDDFVSFPPRVFSFDARLGREKLLEQSRLVASDLVEGVERYWEAKK